MKELLEFIKDLRSNEANFNQLFSKLEQEIQTAQGSENYVADLKNVKEKSAQAYTTAKEVNGSAWPEFEKFVSDFEKAVISHQGSQHLSHQ